MSGMEETDDWLQLVCDNLPCDEHGLYDPLERLEIRILPLLADRAQTSIASLVPPARFDKFYPSVIISYGTGYRSTSKDYPGKLVVAGVVKQLFDRGIECYSDLMTPPGRNWEEFKLRVHSKNASIMVVLMTRAFFCSVWCLEEVKEALDKNFILLPIRVDATSVNGEDISRDEGSMWPDGALHNWVCQENEDGSNMEDERTMARLTELKLARIAVVGKIMNVSSIPAHGTLLGERRSVLDLLAKRINEIDAKKSGRDDTDNVIDTYFAIQRQPSRLLCNLDGRPEMLRDLDTICGDIEKESGSEHKLFDRNYKIYVTDGTNMASALLSSRIRILVWCGRGIDVSLDSPENLAIETICSAYSPEIIVVCMEYGAQSIGQRLHMAMQCTDVVWIGMDPFTDLVKLSYYAFLPFCSSYLRGHEQVRASVEALTWTLRKDMQCDKCDFMPKYASTSLHTKGNLQPRKWLQRGKKVILVKQIDRHLTVSLNWDRSLKQLNVDQGDFDVLADLKAKLSPKDGAEHNIVCVKPPSERDYGRSRALALFGCMDMAMTGMFHDGIYRVARRCHRGIVLEGQPCEALVWVDYLRRTENAFDNADDLVAWVDNLGPNLTATVLLTADSRASFKKLKEMEVQLEELEWKVNAVGLAKMPRYEIPVNTLVGSVAIRSRDLGKDGKVVPLLEMPNVKPRTFAKELDNEVFSFHHKEEDGRKVKVKMFDGSLYCDDYGSIWVRFFVRDVHCLTMLRDRILLGNAAEKLTAALKLEQGSIEFDLSSMAEVFESMILQLETLTKHQEEKLADSEEDLANKMSLHIQGMAGTGKTFLALHLVLNFIDNSTGVNVLYVCYSKATAFQFCKWICRRLGQSKVNASLDKIFFLTSDKANEAYQIQLDASQGVLEEKAQHGILPVKIFDLIVVDEAHHVFEVSSRTAGGDLKASITSLLGEQPESQLILLSDPSQASTDEVDYPKHADLLPVQLSEVCRSTKRIILGARCFQFDTSGDLRFSHDSDGLPSKTIVFPVPRTSVRSEAYADRIMEAVEDVLKKFPGLDLHHRLAIIVPDDDFCKALHGPLFDPLAKKCLRLVPATEACSHVGLHSNNVYSQSQHERSVVLDSVDNMAGLEFLIVFGVGLDESFSNDITARLVCSRIFRAITRTQLMYYFINEEVKDGWSEFLQYTEGINGEFSFEKELANFLPNATSHFLLSQKHNKASIVVAKPMIDAPTAVATEESSVEDKLSKFQPNDAPTAVATEESSVEDKLSKFQPNAMEPHLEDNAASFGKAHDEVGLFHSAAWDTSMITKKVGKAPHYNPWTQKEPLLLSMLRGHTASVRCVAVYANDTRAISGSGDKTLKVWDLTNGQELFTLHGHMDWINCCAVYANDTRAISGSWDKTLKVWDLTNGQELFTLQGHTDLVKCCAVYANDTRVISGSSDMTLKVWDLTNGQEFFLQGHTHYVTCCAVYANDTRVISGSDDQTLKVWDLTNGQELFTLQGHTDYVNCCAVYANDTRVISGSDDKTLKVWDLTNGQELFTLQGHTLFVNCCAVYANDKRVISGSWDKTLKVWDLTNGQELYTLQGHTDRVRCCAVFANDTQVISGSNDTTLRAWSLPSTIDK